MRLASRRSVRAHVDWRATEPRVVVQGPHPFRAHHATHARSGHDPAVARGGAECASPTAARSVSRTDASTTCSRRRSTYIPPAATPNGTAVIVCPGGGYARLAMANEATGRRRALAPRRRRHVHPEVPPREYGHPAPLQDVLRAVRLLRSRAEPFAMRPDRSASWARPPAATLPPRPRRCSTRAEGRTGAALDQISARPDFVSLLYPVITMQPPFAHADSRTQSARRTAVGRRSSTRLSLETQVAARTRRPCSSSTPAEDKSVPIENSVLFYQALRRQAVPAELHLYERGPHGFGTRTDLGTTSGWVDRWIEWMRVERAFSAIRSGQAVTKTLTLTSPGLRRRGARRAERRTLRRRRCRRSASRASIRSAIPHDRRCSSSATPRSRTTAPARAGATTSRRSSTRRVFRS